MQPIVIWHPIGLLYEELKETYFWISFFQVSNVLRPPMRLCYLKKEPCKREIWKVFECTVCFLLDRVLYQVELLLAYPNTLPRMNRHVGISQPNRSQLDKRTPWKCIIVFFKAFYEIKTHFFIATFVRKCAWCYKIEYRTFFHLKSVFIIWKKLFIFVKCILTAQIIIKLNPS